jgi:hypothetical protein
MPEIGEIKKAISIGHQGYCKYIYMACDGCRKEHWVRLKRGIPRHRYCHSCNSKMNLMSKPLEKSSGWKGGICHYQGYIGVKLSRDDPYYPMANKKGYVPEHRLIVAKCLGRCLYPWEIVHHINGIRNDNRYPENLKLLECEIDHLPSKFIQFQLKKQMSEIEMLKQRVTILEAENILLKTSEVPIG